MEAFATWAQEHGVIAAWRYGSTVRGTARPDSDVDVALLLGPRPWEEVETLLEDAARLLAPGLGPRLDVRAIDDAPPALQFRVIAARQLLWEGDRTARVAFERHVMQEYDDVLYHEEHRLAAMRRRLAEGRYGR